MPVLDGLSAAIKSPNPGATEDLLSPSVTGAIPTPSSPILVLMPLFSPADWENCDLLPSPGKTIEDMNAPVAHSSGRILVAWSSVA
jgi:hypothetical protein